MAGVERYFKLGIVGWPLGYSLSPLIHSYALESAGLKGEYREYKVEPEKLRAWLEGEALTLDGFNVTMPHKTAVFDWIRENRSRAELVGNTVLLESVNTVVVKNGRFSGHNTDGTGFLSAFRGAGSELKGWRVVLLGSGGAAKAIAFSLLESGVGQLTIWNRKEHLERAELLAERLNAIAKGFLGVSDFAQAISDLERLPVSECQLLVNATPMGMKRHEQVPETIMKRIHGVQTVYDIVYEPRETGLIQAARRAAAKAITGEVMLVGQGAESFKLWTGTQWMQPVMQQALNEHFAKREKAV